MNEITESKIIELIKKKVVPALGCTEPIAVALAAAKAAEQLPAKPDKIEVYVSGNIYKNGMGVYVPGTGKSGLDIAAALGAIGGNPEKGLEVLDGFTQEDLRLANEMIADNRVEIKVKDNTDKLYVECCCCCCQDNAKVIIAKGHTNITHIEKNNLVIKSENNSPEETKETEEKSGVTIERAYKFATEIDLEKIRFILDSAEMNNRISDEGLEGDYGFKVGKKLKEKIEKKILSDDIMTHAMIRTAAASDARMAGCLLPVMSNSGSGNQGIAVTMPVVAACEKLNVSEDEKIRALAMSHLIAIVIKENLGPLSALCGCVTASTGAACGITYLLGGKLENVIYAIKSMVANITGMICDGAKPGCAFKVSTGASAAVQSALLASDDLVKTGSNGIINEDIERTIRNLSDIGVKGMNETDKLILDIMTCP